jgi:hypothetical protein
MKDKGKVNLVLDALLFLALMAMVGIGLLMKYVLLPGREANAAYGRPVSLTLLGWDRHEWGSVHLVIGFVFLGLLGLHVALHWKTILCLLRRLVPQRAPRIVAASVFVLVGAVAASFALFVAPEVVSRHRHHAHADDYGAPHERAGRRHTRRGRDVRGRWTLAEAAQYAGVPVVQLKAELGLPAATPDDVSLGQLRRQYGWSMAEMRLTIVELATRSSGASPAD